MGGMRNAERRNGAEYPTPWARLMTRRRRKTLVLCPDCHQHTHTR